MPTERSGDPNNAGRSEIMEGCVYGNSPAPPAGPGKDSLDKTWHFFERSSLSLGSVLGVPVRIHAIVILAVAFWFWGSYDRGFGMAFALNCTSFVALSGALLAHEMGHVIVARHLGDYVRGIILVPPVGAVAFILLRPSTSKPLARIAICMAGPMVNLVMAGLIFALRAKIAPDYPLNIYINLSLRFFFMSSLILGVFNLVPLFPMDGGRILRDVLLVCRAGHKASNLIALLVSFLCYIVLAFLSVASSNFYMLAIITVLILLAMAELAFGGWTTEKGEVA
jgi:Zn-dependent protease